MFDSIVPMINNESFQNFFRLLSNISIIATGIGVIFIARQSHIMQKTYQDDHIRSRKTKAHDAIEKLASNLSREYSSCRNLVEELNEEQLGDLKLKKNFEIKKEHAEKLMKCLETCPIENKHINYEGKYILIDSVQSSHIFDKTLQFINLVEVSLINWDSGIADRDIIEEQLSPMIEPRPGKNQYFCENLRRSIGKKSHRNLERFIEKIKRKEENEIAKENQDNMLGENKRIPLFKKYTKKYTPTSH